MTTKDVCCPVCGAGLPLSGPTVYTVWRLCNRCRKEGWKGEEGEDIKRATEAAPPLVNEYVVITEDDPA